MTFKGMLRILLNDYRKQHDEKMFAAVRELIKTRRELQEVKEQLRALQSGNTRAPSSDNKTPMNTIRLFIQYNGLFNQLCDIRQTITVGELLTRVRHLTGIPFDRPIRLRVLSEDGFTTILFLYKELDRTLESYNDCLKAQMILSIEDDDVDNERKEPLVCSTSTTSSKRTYLSYGTDV